MSHFGVLSYKGAGHLNPMIALSRKLLARGHRVTFFQKPEMESHVRQSGLEFCPVGMGTFSSRKKNRTDTSRRPLSGITALREDLQHVIDEMEMSLKEIPAALIQTGVDALIIDEIVLSGATLAQMTGLPYFLISTSVPHHFGWSVSRRLSGSGSGYPASHFTRVRNYLLQLSTLRMRGPIRIKLDDFRRKHELGPIRKIQKLCPALAHITQLPQCIDFTHATLPTNFHYTGPFIDQAARPSMEFPWDKLSYRPLVYASLGTARKLEPTIFRLIAEACNGLGLQLVISLGGRPCDPSILGDLPGRPLVLHNAPQLDLLKYAALVITHGGLNTVLETLMEGRPMIAIPLAYDQPAVAARLAKLKVAEVLPTKDLSAKQVRTALIKLLGDPGYGVIAAELQAKIKAIDGLTRAADVIEMALQNSTQAKHVTQLHTT